MNWTLIGLTWTASLKCLEMTFVVIWRFISFWAAVAQEEEQSPTNQNVGGSTPVSPGQRPWARH